MTISTTSFKLRPLGYYKSEEEFKQVTQKNVTLFKNLILNTQLYNSLYYNSIFQEITTQKFYDQFLNIGTNKYNISQLSVNTSLATTGAALCFVICCKGKDNSGKEFIGLFHTSHILSLDEVLNILKNALLEKNCIENTIEFYILGGKIVTEDPKFNSLEYMLTALFLTNLYNIVGIRFNDSLGIQDGFQVIFTGNKIYYSTQFFFKSIKDKQSKSLFY